MEKKDRTVKSALYTILRPFPINKSTSFVKYDLDSHLFLRSIIACNHLLSAYDVSLFIVDNERIVICLEFLNVQW